MGTPRLSTPRHVSLKMHCTLQYEACVGYTVNSPVIRLHIYNFTVWIIVKTNHLNAPRNADHTTITMHTTHVRQTSSHIISYCQVLYMTIIYLLDSTNLTFVRYCWHTICSPGLMSFMGFLVIAMPLPWQPLSGLVIYVLFFLVRQNAWKSP